MRGRDVLLVDDILDTGRTLARVLAKLRPLQPRRIKICVLLDKPARRVEKIAADYVGFTIPDEFVVGYGLDYDEKYRNLPFVGLLAPGTGAGASRLEQLLQGVDDELHRHRRQQQPEQPGQQFQRQRVEIMRPAHRQPKNPVAGKADAPQSRQTAPSPGKNHAA